MYTYIRRGLEVMYTCICMEACCPMCTLGYVTTWFVDTSQKKHKRHDCRRHVAIEPEYKRGIQLGASKNVLRAERKTQCKPSEVEKFE
mmetsp:Transcript_70444/g.114469  ORF Transcript_70444/g.114469 Transcript_70444/m.114469 type:complete len:88 (-) Transcript_70444:319-582(-)